MAGLECVALVYVTGCGLDQHSADGPPFALDYILLLTQQASHLSCINWVWCWNPLLTAHAHTESPVVKTSMFNTTIMIIVAEHSTKGISKSD